MGPMKNPVISKLATAKATCEWESNSVGHTYVSHKSSGGREATAYLACIASSEKRAVFYASSDCRLHCTVNINASWNDYRQQHTASTKAMSWLGEMVVAKKIHCSATKLNKQVMTDTCRVKTHVTGMIVRLSGMAKIIAACSGRA